MARLNIPRDDLVLQNRGVEIRLSRDYTNLEGESMQRLRALLDPHPTALAFMETLVADLEMRAMWDSSNYITVAKLGYNDHGEVHHKVVATAAASILQLLVEGGVQPDVVSSGAGDLDDAFFVTVAAALLHDVGNGVHRDDHPAYGITLALPLLDRLMPDFYSDVEQRIELRSFILHAIATHDITSKPLTVEASAVCVADACDMTKGRARHVFDIGSISIHTVGALSIERVHIGKGRAKPVRVRVELSNSAGIFPVEEYLVPKVNAGALDNDIEVEVTSQPSDVTTDQRILYTVEMQGRRFIALHDEEPESGAPAANGNAPLNGTLQLK
jgi:metal-dependent HD superfamily phosphatase/phosphodiesterase